MSIEPAPLVLLPGSNCSARLWVGLDVGPSIAAALTEPTLDGQVDRLLAELPPVFDLAGLSLGGIVAMALVRRAPERVRRLALLSTNPYAPTEVQYAAWQAQRQALAAGRTARDLQRDLLPLLLSPGADEELVDTTLAMADEVGASGLDAQLALQATRIDERPGLELVRCPTLVLAARGDALCPVARHKEIAALIPDARLVVIDDCGHLSPVEQPARVTAELLRWRD